MVSKLWASIFLSNNFNVLGLWGLCVCAPQQISNIQLMKLFCANDSDLCTLFYACDFVDFNSVGLQFSLFLIDFFFHLKK
jgi:hypothetical protein